MSGVDSEISQSISRIQTATALFLSWSNRRRRKGPIFPACYPVPIPSFKSMPSPPIGEVTSPEDNNIVTRLQRRQSPPPPPSLFSLPTPGEVIAGISSALDQIFGIPPPAPKVTSATTAPTSTSTSEQPPPETTTSNTDTPPTETTTSTSEVIATATSTEVEQSSSTTDTGTGDATTESSSTTVTSSSSSTEAASTSFTSSSAPSSSAPSSALAVVTSSTLPDSTLSLTSEGVATETGVSTSDRTVKKNTPMIAGSVIGVLALFSISLLLFLCFRRRYLRRRRAAELEEASSFIMPIPRHFEPQRYLPAKFRDGRERIPPSPSTAYDHQATTDSEEPEDGGTHSDEQHDEPRQITGSKSLHIVIPPLRGPPPYTP
ncbi:hypothetical protein E1B28_009533 [Marasmius oreades]|nr:uncharacterized protein E1B28_009533 [Marasmius oreades]KAG7090414.1 hypothetical protein E1B28_009533 [Marasmius oreades]